VSGSHHPAIAPYGMFSTATSPVQVAVGSEGLWQKFAPAVGLDPADERFAAVRMAEARGHGPDLGATGLQIRPDFEHHHGDAVPFEKILPQGRPIASEQDEIDVAEEERLALALDRKTARIIGEERDGAVVNEGRQRGDLFAIRERQQQLIRTQVEGCHAARPVLREPVWHEEHKHADRQKGQPESRLQHAARVRKTEDDVGAPGRTGVKREHGPEMPPKPWLPPQL
jgi:hypothetical protein